MAFYTFYGIIIAKQFLQQSNIGLLTQNIPALIKFISACITPMPGNIVTIGTPEGIRRLGPGDIVAVEIEGNGILRNSVVLQQ